jgi:hypothetical protein
VQIPDIPQQQVVTPRRDEAILDATVGSGPVGATETFVVLNIIDDNTGSIIGEWIAPPDTGPALRGVAMTGDSSAKRFAHVVRALTLAGMPLVIRESTTGSLVTVTTKGLPVFTVSRDIALEAGLLSLKKQEKKS